MNENQINQETQEELEATTTPVADASMIEALAAGQIQDVDASQHASVEDEEPDDAEEAKPAEDLEEEYEGLGKMDIATLKAMVAQKNSGKQQPSQQRLRRGTFAFSEFEVQTVRGKQGADNEAEQSRQEAELALMQSNILNYVLSGKIAGVQSMPSNNGDERVFAVVMHNVYKVMIPFEEFSDVDIDALVARRNEMSTDGRPASKTDIIKSYMVARIGAEIDYVVTLIPLENLEENKLVIASRKLAMERNRMYYWYGTIRGTSSFLLQENKKVEARIVAVARRVVRLEMFGIEMPVRISDMIWKSVPDAREVFSVGQYVTVLLKKVERTKDENNIRSVTVEVSGRELTPDPRLRAMELLPTGTTAVGYVSHVTRINYERPGSMPLVIVNLPEYGDAQVACPMPAVGSGLVETGDKVMLEVDHHNTERNFIYGHIIMRYSAGKK